MVIVCFLLPFQLPFLFLELQLKLMEAFLTLRNLVSQLLNVLKGDMSLVGPRPHPLDDYSQYSLDHLRRLDVKPGITGLWQIKARQNPSFERNMELDLGYIDNWSLWLDLEIALRTVPAILRAEGQKQSAIAAATGEAQRFLSVYNAYIQAKDITLKRIYIETMQEVLSHAETTVVDDRLRNLLPVLPLGGKSAGEQK